MLHEDYNRKCSVEKKSIGRESQGACRQDELSRKVTQTQSLVHLRVIRWRVTS
jgi:hypothetical protein